MSFRILNQFPVYLGLTGQLAAGGELRFYDSGTTTPKSVFGNKALTIDNGATVLIGSDGRTVVDVWGDGSYRVRLYAQDGTLIDEADNVEIAGGDAATIPALVDGWFLTNNGALLLWAQILQLPDPTGQDGKMVVADGAGYLLQPVPTAPVVPAPDIVVVANSFRGGVSVNATKGLFQCGTGSAPATGTKQTQAAVAYPTPYATAPFPVLTPTGGPFAPGNITGYYADFSISSSTNSGFTVIFNTNHGEANSDGNINAAVTFNWMAYGTVEVPP